MWLLPSSSLDSRPFLTWWPNHSSCPPSNIKPIDDVRKWGRKRHSTGRDSPVFSSRIGKSDAMWVFLRQGKRYDWLIWPVPCRLTPSFNSNTNHTNRNQPTLPHQGTAHLGSEPSRLWRKSTLHHGTCNDLA
jgi:hypothetical protein